MLNVLFITADQWRGECLSALGHPCLRTPHLDRLAESGVLFTRHFSQATPCSPGRTSLYTGLYLHNHRVVVNGTPLDARHANVALEARKLGYDPVLFGYTDTGADPRIRAPGDPALRTYTGVLPGMTPVVQMDDDHWPWRRHLARRGYEVPEDTEALFAPGHDDYVPGQAISAAAAAYPTEDGLAGFLTEKVIEHLSAKGREPWFVHVSFFPPHPPFIASAPYNAMYAPDDVPPPVRASTPEEEARQHPYLAYYLYHQRGSGIAYGQRSLDHLTLGDHDIRQARANYYALMSEVDAQIGRLLDHLRASGAEERTLVVFTSDHGEHLGDHWQFSKYSYFDQTFHVPLIVRDPRAAAAPGRGRQVSSFTENVDVMPTILDALGLEVPPQCDGQSLVPFLAGDTPARWRREAHFEFDFRDILERPGAQVLGLAPDQCTLCALRGERYKYVHFTAMPPLFFDLEDDPAEMVNRAEDPQYQERMLEYAQKMLSWRMSHDERVLANVRLTPNGLVEHRPERA